MKSKEKLVIISAIILIILIVLLIIYKCVNKDQKEPVEIIDDQEQSVDLSVYFGEDKSYTDVKAFMKEIRDKNISLSSDVDSDENSKKIYIAFGKPEELQIKTPQEVTDLVNKDKKYWIGIVNTNNISNDGTDEVETEIKVDSEGYYSDGQIRLITIYEK